MSTVFNLSILAGETPVLAVTVTDSLGVAISLVGATAYYAAALPVPIAKAVGAGITLTDPANGKMEIAFAQVDTEYVDSVLEVHHECKVKTAAGKILVPFSGYLVVNDSLIDSI